MYVDAIALNQDVLKNIVNAFKLELNAHPCVNAKIAKINE